MTSGGQALSRGTIFSERHARCRPRDRAAEAGVSALTGDDPCRGARGGVTANPHRRDRGTVSTFIVRSMNRQHVDRYHDQDWHRADEPASRRASRHSRGSLHPVVRPGRRSRRPGRTAVAVGDSAPREQRQSPHFWPWSHRPRDSLYLATDGAIVLMDCPDGPRPAYQRATVRQAAP